MSATRHRDHIVIEDRYVWFYFSLQMTVLFMKMFIIFLVVGSGDNCLPSLSTDIKNTFLGKGAWSLSIFSENLSPVLSCLHCHTKCRNDASSCVYMYLDVIYFTQPVSFPSVCLFVVALSLLQYIILTLLLIICKKTIMISRAIY